ncbi:MAG: SRPBCC domain-containing protein [Sneathiella sp.]
MNGSSYQADNGRAVEAVEVRECFGLSLEKAFAAWSQPEKIERWFGPPGFKAKVLEHDFNIGGKWCFQMISEAGESFHHFGTFVDIQSPNSLVFTWSAKEEIRDWGAWNTGCSLVTVYFVEQGTGTEITIRHENLATNAARTALRGGWTGSLQSLAAYVERGENEWKR